jgi:hypothetical protein
MKRLVDEPISPQLARVLRSARRDVPADARARQERIVATAAERVSFDGPPRTAGIPWFTRHVTKIGLASLLVVLSAAVATRWTNRGVGLGIAVDERSPRALSSASFSSEPTSLAVTEPRPTGEMTESRVDGTSPPSAIVPSRPAEALSVSVDALPSAPRRGDDDATTRKPRPSTSALGDELALVDAARVALAHGEPRSTLARIAEYRTRFSSPRFSDEADALEVSALVALGDKSLARSKAERFVANHPDSPYLQRVRSVVRNAE